MTDTPRDELIAKNLPLIAALVVAVGATAVRVRFGWASVILWLAFCALSGAILLFWESMRSALDPESLGDDNDADLRALAQSELEDRKRAALRALKDIREEHSLGKLSDDDFNALDARYRAEAREVMRSLDELLGDHLARAQSEFDQIADETLAKAREGSQESAATDAKPAAEAKPTAEAKPAAEASAPSDAPMKSERARHECAACNTVNDPDARFCKGCGGKLESASP